MVTKSLFYQKRPMNLNIYVSAFQIPALSVRLFASVSVLRGTKWLFSTAHLEIMDLGGRKNERIIKFRDLLKKHLNLMGWKSLITPNKGRDSSKMHFILKVILKMEPWFVVSIKFEWNHLNKNLIPNSCPDQPLWYFPPLIYCHCIQTLASHFPEITKTKRKIISLPLSSPVITYYHFFWVTIAVKDREFQHHFFFSVLILFVFDEVGSSVGPQSHSTLVPRKGQIRFHKSGRLLHFQNISRSKSTVV